MDYTLADIPCIILAGGKGTRLKSALPDLPKPMAPIGKKPFLHVLLETLYKQGFRHFHLSVGYKKDVILSYFTSKEMPFEVNFIEESEPLGTGGAIANALKQLNNYPVLILNGDTFFEIEFNDFIEKSIKKNTLCSLALKRIESGDRYGEVQLEGNTVTSFTEKKPLKNSLINGGIYFINSTLFKNHTFPKNFSFETDFLEHEVQNKAIAGFEQDGYFIDIGIPEDYKKAQDELI